MEKGLSYDLQSNVPAKTINADGNLLARLLDNLIGNAIKYGADGKRGLVQSHAESETVTVSVTNYGYVIPADELPLIFNKFYRVEQSRSSSTGGTGLGLAIAKKIVDRLDGDIAIESKKGVGTTVTMTLPFKIGEPVEKEKNVNYEEIPVEGLRALLAEDNELNMEIAKFMLEDYGIHVECAADGEEAVQKFKNLSWDITM